MPTVDEIEDCFEEIDVVDGDPGVASGHAGGSRQRVESQSTLAGWDVEYANTDMQHGPGDSGLQLSAASTGAPARSPRMSAEAAEVQAQIDALSYGGGGVSEVHARVAKKSRTDDGEGSVSGLSTTSWVAISEAQVPGKDPPARAVSVRSSAPSAASSSSGGALPTPPPARTQHDRLLAAASRAEPEPRHASAGYNVAPPDAPGMSDGRDYGDGSWANWQRGQSWHGGGRSWPSGGSRGDQRGRSQGSAPWDWDRSRSRPWGGGGQKGDGKDKDYGRR